MSRNEATTCREVIEPALITAQWAFDRQVTIGPGRVNLTGERMYDDNQKIIADYVLRLWSMPLAVLEAKAEGEDAADGMQQGSRYAQRLGLRFSIATNGSSWIVTDNETGEYEPLTAVPTPGDILRRLGRETIPQEWHATFAASWYIDQVTRKRVRPYQEVAIFEALYAFSQERRRALLLMATGTGKTFTMFQLVWKLLEGKALPNSRVLFLTDRNSLKGQAYRAFSGFSKHDRVVVESELVANKNHLVGKIFFANYQNLDEDLEGKKIYEHFPADFFDLVIIDECHRSGFGDWFSVLEHFGSAYQLGLTATPRELELESRELTTQEKRRDTYEYFGAPIYTYSLKQAIEDGYLVPYLLEQRVTNVDDHGFTGPDGKLYRTENFERDIRMPDRTKFIAEDLYETLRKHDLHNEKTIVFCVDDTHAAFMAQELRRVAGDRDYAARITRAERNSHQLERNFAEVGRSKPRVAVTVDLLTTGFDAPDVKNIVFVRPLKSAILYKQMKGRGTRLCEDIDKRYFTIFDYSAASTLEDAEFDGHPANVQKPPKPKSKPKASAAGDGSSAGDGSAVDDGTRPTASGTITRPIGGGVAISLSRTERFVCLADGQKIPFADYRERSKEVIRGISASSPDELLKLWIDKNSRKEVREQLTDRDIHIAAFRHFFDLVDADDVDILGKVGFDLGRVPLRRDRADRLWTQDEPWLLWQLEEAGVTPEQAIRLPFWSACLDHYALFGIDDLEDARTYGAPQFVERFGGFRAFADRYGGPHRMRADLEAVKQHLYVSMAA
ncbi:Type I restriction-modification system, restriction subunit R [Minicystis rosea]|nr:Type I restriction-modification system, restriction subunit R [Minicystis rosea]